jgi:hypothetical protein
MFIAPHVRSGKSTWDSLVLQVLGASLVHRFTEVELFMEGARCPLHDKMVHVANFVAGDGEGFATLTRWSSVLCDQFAADNLYHIPLSNVHGNPTVPLNVLSTDFHQVATAVNNVSLANTPTGKEDHSPLAATSAHADDL